MRTNERQKYFPLGRHRTPDPLLTHPATYHCSAAASAESAFRSALNPCFRSATEKFRVRREKVAIMQKMTPWIVFRAYQDPIPQVSASEAILNWMTSLVRRDPCIPRDSHLSRRRLCGMESNAREKSMKAHETKFPRSRAKVIFL